MCELSIARADHHHDDPVVDQRGCYKRGDIIRKAENGAMADMPHLTVVSIPEMAASHGSLKWLSSPRYEVITTRRPMRQSEYDELQVVNFNERSRDFDGSGARAFGQHRRTQAPELVRVIDGTAPDSLYEVDDTIIDIYTRRLYQIPAGRMNELFPSNTTRVELTIPQAVQLLADVINKREA